MKTMQKLNVCPAKLVLKEYDLVSEFTVGLLTNKGKILEVYDGEEYLVSNRVDGKTTHGCQEWFHHELKAASPIVICNGNTWKGVENSIIAYRSAPYEGTSSEYAYNRRPITEEDIQDILDNEGNCFIEMLSGADLYNHWFSQIDGNSVEGYDFDVYEKENENKIPVLVRGRVIIHTNNK